MEKSEKELALAKLVLLTTRSTKEANSPRGETKKTAKEYVKALTDVCNMLEIDVKEVENLIG